jgi:alpha-galactosidase
MNILARAITVLLFMATLCAPAIRAQSRVQSPPMGWNSWDAYGLTITEAQFRANVSVLKQKLLPFGWRYAVIDEGWFFENPQDRPHPEKLVYAIDSHGRYVPVPARFPSAAAPPDPQHLTGTSVPPTSVILETSFAPLGRWVHAQGLLFGIHIVRGIPRVSVERNLPIDAPGNFHAQDSADQTDACPWDPTNWGIKNNAAGQAWYDSLLRQYAAWGIDLLKVDCISDHPYKEDEIRMIRRAIDKTGRPMVLSLSPGPTSTDHAQAVSELATMWRVSEDVWDIWDSKPAEKFPQSVKNQFERAMAWDHFGFSHGHWPDMDMLPLGELRPSPGWGDPRHTRLTPDEQRTLITLWATSRSPLILGANLTLLDDFTLQLLTNRTVLRIDQQAQVSGETYHVDNLLIRRAELPPERTPTPVVALFNLGDTPLVVDMNTTDLGLRKDSRKTIPITDVWTDKSLGQLSRVHLTLAPHACMLLMSR